MLKVIRKLLVKHNCKYEKQQRISAATNKKNPNLKVELTGLQLTAIERERERILDCIVMTSLSPKTCCRRGILKRISDTAFSLY